MSKKSKAQKQSNTKQLLSNEWKIVCIILLITFFAYLNTLQNDWAYDDWFQIARNQEVTSWSNIPKTFTQSVWRFLDESSKQSTDLYYRPIFNSVLIIQYQLFGQKVWAWHLVSVLLHLIVVLLVYALARVWNLDKTIAAVAALIFGLHPVHSEAVAWISSSPDLIASIFILASLLSYEKARAAHIQLHRSWMCACLVFALLAMFTKEQSVMLLPFIAVREIFDNSEDAFKAKLKRAASRASFFIIPVVLYFAARYHVLGFILRSYWSETEAITFKEMILTLPSVMLTYARMLFAPYPLMIMYEHPIAKSFGDMIFLLPLLALTVISAAVVWLIKSHVGWRSIFFLILFLLPVLNIRFFNNAESVIHDRYLYLPSIGFCLLVALGIKNLSERFNEQKKFLIVTTSTIALICFVLIFFQNKTWRDDFALFNHALKFAPEKPFLINALANAHSENNQFSKAEKFYRKAVELKPDYVSAYIGLGFSLSKQQRYDEAVKAFQKVIDLSEPLAPDYFNLGSAYIGAAKFDEAEKALLKSLELNPEYSPAHYNLGWLYQQQGKKDLAQQHYLKAAQFQKK